MLKVQHVGPHLLLFIGTAYAFVSSEHLPLSIPIAITPQPNPRYKLGDVILDRDPETHPDGFLGTIFLPRAIDAGVTYNITNVPHDHPIILDVSGNDCFDSITGTPEGAAVHDSSFTESFSGNVTFVAKQSCSGKFVSIHCKNHPAMSVNNVLEIIATEVPTTTPSSPLSAAPSAAPSASAPTSPMNTMAG